MAKGGCLGCFTTILVVIAGVTVLGFVTLGLGDQHFSDDSDRNHEKTIKVLGEPSEDENAACYYYSQLSGDEQDAYRLLLDCLDQGEETVELPVADEDELDNIFEMVMSDHPELFWVKRAYSYRIYEEYCELSPKYNYEGEEKEERQQEVDAAVAQAVSACYVEGSDYDRARQAFTYVIDMDDYNENAADNQNIYSAFVGHETVCAGYAKATQYILQKMGITAFLVTGSVQTPDDHAWLIAEIDGAYYHIDPTYGDPNYSETDVSSLPEDFKYDFYYLCCDDDNMYRDRTVSDLLPVPACDSDIYDYYRMNDCYFDECSDEVTDDIIDGILDGDDYYSCQFSNEEAYDAFMEEVRNGLYSQLLLEYRENDILSLESWYSNDDQTYVVELWY